MLCPIKVNNNTIKLQYHTSCYSELDFLCVTIVVKVVPPVGLFSNTYYGLYFISTTRMDLPLS